MPLEAQVIYAARWAGMDPVALWNAPIAVREWILTCMSAWNEAERLKALTAK